MILHSIRWRLQIWYGLILLALLAGFGFTAYQLERGHQFRRLDDELRRRAGQLINLLRPGSPGRGRPEDFGGEGPPPGQPRSARSPRPPREQPLPPDRAFDEAEPGPFPHGPDGFRPPFIANNFDESDTNGFYYVIIALSPERKELARSSNAPPDAGAALSLTNVVLRRDPIRPPHPEAGEPPAAQIRGSFRELFLLPPRGPALPPEARSTVILVGHSIVTELNDLRLFAWMLTGVGGFILLLGLAGGW